MDSRFYYFGDPKFASTYFDDTTKLKPLGFQDLFQMRSEDVLVSPRPWPLLFEFLSFFQRTRPHLVQLADGVIFPLNCVKKVNQRYQGMYRNIFADGLVVQQNLSELATITNDRERLFSVVNYDATISRQCVANSALMLVCGNDPVLGLRPANVVEAFVEACEKFRNLGLSQVFLSCPDKRFAARLTDRLPFIQSIGRLCDFQGKDDLIYVGSPSTVLLQKFLAGQKCALLSLYANLATLPSLSTHLKVLESFESGLSPSCQFSMITKPIAITKLKIDELRHVFPRREILITKRDFLFNLSVRLFARELWFLCQRRRPGLAGQSQN